MAAREQTPSIELPMTPAHEAAVRHIAKGQRQWPLGASAAAFTFALSLQLLFGELIMPVMMLAGFAVVFGWATDRFYRRRSEADLKRGTYVQTTGPTRIMHSTTQYFTVRVGTVELRNVSEGEYDLRDLDVSTIDYAPRSKVIFEQRDADGKVVYRPKQYRPDAPDTLGPEPRLWKAVAWGSGCGAALVVLAEALTN